MATATVPRIMETPLVKVNSSAISYVGYNPDSHVLKVMFKETPTQPPRVYTYSNVNQNVFDRFLIAPSIGQFYNQEIKGRFPSVNLV